MNIVWMVVIGFFIGLVARALMPGRDTAGFIVTALLGIAGSVVAGLIGSATGIYAQGDPAGFLASVLGAMLVLFVYHRAVGARA